MNIDLIKEGLSFKMSRTGLYLQKHSPEILLATGLVGMVATVVIASKATRNLDEILREKNAKIDQINDLTSDDATEQEIVRAKVETYAKTGLALAKLYGPAVVVGSLSVAAILGAHDIMAKRQVALTAAYGLAVEAYNAYRARVEEELGAEKEQQIYLGLTEETETVKEVNEEGKKVKVKKTKLVQNGRSLSIYARCFDNSNRNFQTDRRLNRAFIMGQERYINDVLLLEGHVFLNEVYRRLGFEPTPEGQLVGWVLKDPIAMKKEGRDGYISFGLDAPLSQADREFLEGTNDAVWLDFNVDGVVFQEL